MIGDRLVPSSATARGAPQALATDSGGHHPQSRRIYPHEGQGDGDAQRDAACRGNGLKLRLDIVRQGAESTC